MITKALSSLHKAIASTGTFRLSSKTDVVQIAGSPGDYETIVNGLTLWFGILLDYNSFLFESSCEKTAHRARSRQGRLLCSAGLGAWPSSDIFQLGLFLTALDDLASVQLEWMRQVQDFKGPVREQLAHEVQIWLGKVKRAERAASPPPARQFVSFICDNVCAIICDYIFEDADGGGAQLHTMFRQIVCFLRKLEVDRPDLQDSAVDDFLSKEAALLESSGPESVRSPEYLRDMREMRALYRQHSGPLDWSKFAPCHGNGAVADPRVKSFLQKYEGMHEDDRLGYLLGHSGLGPQDAYSPFAKGNAASTRTSRFCAVPKTWKKLRGISAEPTELQFWQHGLSSVIDSFLRRDKFWCKRVDLHDQAKSQKLALSGSIDGIYATVDLSEASDSVTRRLVFDLFGNTELGRWLLGTRSVYTEYGPRRQRIRLAKFAPMGSNTCFPTECMVFALAAQVAVNRTRSAANQRYGVQVYGDDIVLPSYAYDELVSILGNLGFKVNADKSFSKGFFRESCGTEAWRGVDIAPLRFTKAPMGLLPTSINSGDLSTSIALANGLFMRGLHQTRAFWLGYVWGHKIHLVTGGNTRKPVKHVPGFIPAPVVHKEPYREYDVPCSMAVFASFTGARSTFASSQPTNFHLVRKYCRDIQQIVYDVVEFETKSYLDPKESMLSAFDACRFIEWLVRHQPLTEDEEDEPLWNLQLNLNPVIPEHMNMRAWSKLTADIYVAERASGLVDTTPERLAAEVQSVLCDFLKSFVSDYQSEAKVAIDPYARLPIGSTLVPFRTWVNGGCRTDVI